MLLRHPLGWAKLQLPRGALADVCVASGCDCKARRRVPSSFSVAAGRPAWVLAAHHVLALPVGSLEPTELLHESIPYGANAPNWEDEGVSW